MKPEWNEKWEKRRLDQPGRVGDQRSAFDRDLARIIHCAAFRRLQGKTQLLGIGEGDFHRTRLTHSMETAQIGRGLVQTLRKKRPGSEYLSSTVVEAIALAHDIGHPPFGHGGETALNYEMRDSGGFEGNGQTLRLLSKLESHTANHGLNLTRRVLLGVLKYPLRFSTVCRLPKHVNPQEKIDRLKVKVSDWKPPKCYFDCEQDIVDWIFEPLSPSDRNAFVRTEPPDPEKHLRPSEKSFDCSMMEIADDIAYGVHDLEDAIALRLIEKDAVAEALKATKTSWRKKWQLENTVRDLFKKERRKDAIGKLVHALISSAETQKIPDFEEPLLAYRAQLIQPARDLVEALKRTVKKNVLFTAELQTLEYRGQVMLMEIFEALSSEPIRLMKKNFSEMHELTKDYSKGQRVICDYVSGMTDEYAIRVYERLFVPREGTIFERL